MSEAEYESWSQGQTDRYEFVDGRPQLKFSEWVGPKLMTGARQAHNLIAGNCFFLLRQALAGKACRPYASDGKVVTPQGNHRFPDVTVDCGKFRPAEVNLEAPAAVIEILSKSTHWIDTTRKLEDYKSVASIRHIVFLSQDEARGQCWSRGRDWDVAYFEGFDAEIALPAIGVRLSLAAVYEGALEAAPQGTAGFQPAD